MVSPIQVLAVEQDSIDGIIVKFTDETIAGYVVEELLKLRPKRERTMQHKVSDIAEQASKCAQ
jgi:hypothetical protein